MSLPALHGHRLVSSDQVAKEGSQPPPATTPAEKTVVPFPGKARMPPARHKSSSTLVANPLDENVRRRIGSLLATSRRYTGANGWEATKPRRNKSVDCEPYSGDRVVTTTAPANTKNLNANANGVPRGGGKVCVLNAIIMDSSDFSSAREEAHAWDRRFELALPMSLENNVNQKRTRRSVSDLGNAADESSDSSGSNSTVTQASFARRDSPTIPAPNERPKKAPAPRPDALRFLVEDTDARPFGAEDEPPRGRRSTVSSVGSTTSSTKSGKSAASGAGGDDNDTDQNTSPELSPKTPKGRHLAVDVGNNNNNNISGSSKSKRQRSYGTPEMPRGSANLPHVSPSLLTPRASNFGHVKHLPRAEKLPLSGYELLASRLSTAGAPAADAPGEPQLQPIYRRFEPLNHRLLLHLQDELCELEEQLHRLDTADTQNRRLQNGILPASRRADAQTAGELQWHKTDILGKIGFKLEQYSRIPCPPSAPLREESLTEPFFQTTSSPPSRRRGPCPGPPRPTSARTRATSRRTARSPSTRPGSWTRRTTSSAWRTRGRRPGRGPPAAGARGGTSTGNDRCGSRAGAPSSTRPRRGCPSATIPRPRGRPTGTTRTSRR